MKTSRSPLIPVFLCITSVGAIAGEPRAAKAPSYDAALAKRLGAGFGNNDRSYRGLYIFNVATVEEAEKLVILDPAVKAGVFAYELTPWYGSAAMMMVTETHKRIEKPKN